MGGVGVHCAGAGRPLLLGTFWKREGPLATLNTVLLGLPQAACEVLLPPQSLQNPGDASGCSTRVSSPRRAACELLGLSGRRVLRGTWKSEVLHCALAGNLCVRPGTLACSHLTVLGRLFSKALVPLAWSIPSPQNTCSCFVEGELAKGALSGSASFLSFSRGKSWE